MVRGKLRRTSFWFKNGDNLYFLDIFYNVGSANDFFVVRYLNDPSLVNIMLRLGLYPPAEQFSWRIQYRKSSALLSGVRHHGDGLRKSISRS